MSHESRVASPRIRDAVLFFSTASSPSAPDQKSSPKADAPVPASPLKDVGAIGEIAQGKMLKLPPSPPELEESPEPSSTTYTTTITQSTIIHLNNSSAAVAPFFSTDDDVGAAQATGNGTMKKVTRLKLSDISKRRNTEDPHGPSSPPRVISIIPYIPPTRVHTPLRQLFNYTGHDAFEYDGRAYVKVIEEGRGEGRSEKEESVHPQSARERKRATSFTFGKNNDRIERKGQSSDVAATSLEEKRAAFRRSLSEHDLTSHKTGDPTQLFVRLNPLLEMSFDASSAERALLYFTGMSNKRIYNSKKAAKEVSDLLQRFPTHQDTILEIVLKVRESANGNGRADRFQKVLFHVFKEPQNLPFLISYFAKNPDEMEGFASKLIKKKDSTFLLGFFLSTTSGELKQQTRDTMFRQASFSSCLGNLHGAGLLSDQIKQLDQKILAELTQCDPSAFVIPRPQLKGVAGEIKSEMLRKDPSLNDLEPHTLDGLVDEEIKKRITGFSDFARIALNQLYDMEMPDQFCELLRQRRALLYRFLEENPIKDEDREARFALSRSYVSELLFLRILNPHLVTLDQDPDKQRALIILSKLIQRLANETETKVEFDNPLVDKCMDSLYAESIERHRRFVDAAST